MRREAAAEACPQHHFHGHCAPAVAVPMSRPGGAFCPAAGPVCVPGQPVSPQKLLTWQTTPVAWLVTLHFFFRVGSCTKTRPLSGMAVSKHTWRLQVGFTCLCLNHGCLVRGMLAAAGTGVCLALRRHHSGKSPCLRSFR